MYRKILSLSAIRGAGFGASLVFLGLLSVTVPQGEIGMYGTLVAYLNIVIAISGLGFEKLLIRDFLGLREYNYTLLSCAIWAQLWAAASIGAIAAMFLPTGSEGVLPLFIIAAAAGVLSRSYERVIRLQGSPRLALSINVGSVRLPLVGLGAAMWYWDFGLRGSVVFGVYCLLLVAAFGVYWSLVPRVRINVRPARWRQYLVDVLHYVRSGRYFWFNNSISVVSKEIDTIAALYLIGGEGAAVLFVGRRIYNVLSIINLGAQFGYEHELSRNRGSVGQSRRLFSNIRNTTVLLAGVLAVLLTGVMYLVEYQFGILKGVFFVSVIFMVTRISENQVGPVFEYLHMRGGERSAFFITTWFLCLKTGAFVVIPDIDAISMAFISGLAVLGAAMVGLWCCRNLAEPIAGEKR